MKNSREIERISQFICLVRIFAFRYPAEIFYGRYKKPYERQEVAWGELTISSLPPMQLDCDGQSILQRIGNCKCLAFCDFFYTWQSCCIVALIFLSLLNSYLFFKMSVHPGQRASIDLRLNDVRQLRLILSSYF